MADPQIQAHADVFATLGVSATYDPAIGSPFTINVIRSDDMEGVGEHGQVIHLGTVFDINRADVDQPAHGDKIQIGTTTWTVQEIVARDQYMTRVTIRG